MTGRIVRRNGVRIQGKWYWNEAMYGLHGWVYYEEVKGNAVEIYDVNFDRICTATLLEGIK